MDRLIEDGYIDELIDYSMSDDDALDLSYDEFAERYLYILDKDGEVSPFVRNELQRHFYHARQESNKNFHLIIKPRQGGISTDIQGEMIYYAVTGPLLGATMADDSDNTQHMRDISSTFYNNLDKSLGIKRATDNASMTTYTPTNAKIRIGTAGVKHKGRSGTYTMFHGSEVAFWNDPKSTLNGALQGLVPGGTCIFESTANGAQGWVWETVNNPGKWHIHFYAWWWVEEYQLALDDGEILVYTEDELKCIALAEENGFDLTPEQIKWRRDKKSETTKFEQEYPETLESAFIKSGRSFFGDITKALYLLPHDYKINYNHHFVGGIDWGQQDDYTTLSIIDIEDNREVFLDRWNKIDWDSILARLVEACTLFRVERVHPEFNSMSMQVGRFRELMKAAVIEFNAEHEDVPIKEQWWCTVFAVSMDNDGKGKLVNNLYRAIHYEGLQLLDIEYANTELATFVQTQSKHGNYLYDHILGGKSDTVIARLLSKQAMQRIVR